jgi:hypothetical protein
VVTTKEGENPCVATNANNAVVIMRWFLIGQNMKLIFVQSSPFSQNMPFSNRKPRPVIMTIVNTGEKRLVRTRS